MNAICVIPARGGSKRIPKKNIRPFFGKPMLQWSIEAALESGLFSRVIVSTDSEEIANTARNAGAEIPFIRDASLADDFTSTNDVIKDAAARIYQVDKDLQWVCCLYATAPFITAEVLKDGFARLRISDADMAFSVTAFDFPIFRSIEINLDGKAQMFWPENERKRSQDLPKAYHDAGQFYWYKLASLLSRDYVSFNGAIPVVLHPKMVQDIDTIEDWEMAEFKMQEIVRTKMKGLNSNDF